MIVSLQRNYVFIKTRKVAGTSIEIALSTSCGPNDIVTPIEGPRTEIARFKLGGGPRNFSADRELENSYIRAIESEDEARIREALRAVKPKLLFWNHMPAHIARERLAPAFWNGAFKFTVERHPFDFVTSLYYFMLATGTSQLCRWPEMMLYNIILRTERNFGLYAIHKCQAVDRVLRYEALAEELRTIAPVIGVDISGNLPLAKAGLRPVDGGRPLLHSVHKALIRYRWSREFALYGYDAKA